MVLVVKEVFLVVYFLNFLNCDGRDFCWGYWPCVFLLLVRIFRPKPGVWGGTARGAASEGSALRKSGLAACKTLENGVLAFVLHCCIQRR